MKRKNEDEKKVKKSFSLSRGSYMWLRIKAKAEGRTISGWLDWHIRKERIKEMKGEA